MIEFTGHNVEAAGYIPLMLDANSELDAVAQLDAGYAHGGGWHPFEGFTMRTFRNGQTGLEYPGDPITHEQCRAIVGDETVIVYEHAWVAVVQKDGSHSIARMD